MRPRLLLVIAFFVSFFTFNASPGQAVTATDDPPPDSPAGGLLALPLGGLITLGTTVDDSTPAVAQSTGSGPYLVVWSTASGDGDVRGRFVDAATGSPMGSSFAIAESSQEESNPDVVYDVLNDRFLVVWDKYICTPSVPSYCGYVIKGRLVYASQQSPQFPAGEFTIASQVTNMTTSYDLRHPAAAYDYIEGLYQVVFMRSTMAGSGTYRQIYGQMLSAGATTANALGPASGFAVRSYGSTYQVSPPDIDSALSHQTFLATWGVAQDSDVDYIAIAYLHGTYRGNDGADQLQGSWWLAPYNYGDHPISGNTTSPKVAYHQGAGKYVVVFEHNNTALNANSPASPQLATTEIYAQVVNAQYDAGGFIAYGEYAFPVETAPSAFHGQPDIRWHTSNYMSIVYWSFDFNLDGPDFYFLNHRSMQVPSKLGDGFTLRAAAADHSIAVPAIACAGNNACLSIWQEQYTGDGDPDWDILGQRIDTACYSLAIQLDPQCPGCSVDATETLMCSDLDYEPGKLVTLTATPGGDYTFSHWSGDLTGSQNPAQVTMDAGKSVTAHFSGVGVNTLDLFLPVILRP